MDFLFNSPAVPIVIGLAVLYFAWGLIAPRLALPAVSLSLDDILTKLLGERYAQGKLERRAAEAVKTGNTLTAGKLFEDAGMPERALDTYLKGEEWMAAGFLLEGMPGKIEKAGEMFLKAGDYKKAAEVYTAAGKPGRAAPLFEEKGNNLEAARLYGLAQQWDKAAALFVKSGYSARAAEAYEKTGDFLKAAEAYEKHFMENVTFSTTYSGPPPASETKHALRAGQLYEQAGLPEKAREIYLRGSFFSHAARVSLALSQFEKAAELFLRAEDISAAADAYERGGDAVKAANYRGEVAFKAGKLAEAAAFFHAGQDYQRAAELFEQLGMLERAAQAYEAGHSHTSAGGVYLRGGQKDKAASCFERGGEYETAARLYAEAGNGAKAAELYEKAGQTYRSGLAAAEAGDAEKAIGLLQRVTAQDEDYEQATERLAELFLGQRLTSLAIERLLKVIAGRPVAKDNLNLYYWLALAREAAGEGAAALPLYKGILAEEFHFRDVADRSRALEAGQALPLPAAARARQPSAAAGGTAAAVARAPTPPTGKPPRFLIKEELARGPLGVIHLGEDSADGQRSVAIRLLPPEAAPHLAALIADLKAAAAVAHPSLVRLLGVVELSGRRAVVSERIQGASLAASPGSSRRLGLPQAQAVARALAQALAAIHAKGLAHGSIQPSNVMSSGGALKLADLGLGRLHLALVPAHSYRAPEGGLTAAADVYSFGALVHALLTGKPGDASAELPAPFSRLLPRCLEAKPESRPSAQEILAALEAKA